MKFPLLVRMQWAELRNLFGTFQEQSKLKISLITTFALGLWMGLYWLFYKAFSYLQQFYVLASQLTVVIFALFFFALLIMLTFSNGIIIFSSLFRSQQTSYLLHKPIPPEDIYLSCFGAAIAFSSWAFLFLAAPLMMAYGVVYDLAIWFYPIAFAFFIPFIFLPAAMGALLTLVITYFFPRGQKAVLAILVLLLIGVSIYMAVDFQTLNANTQAFSEGWLEQVLGKLSFARNPIYPSVWLTEGILAASAENYSRVGFYFLLMVSNAMFFIMVSYLVAGKLFRPCYNLISSAGGKKFVGGRDLVDQFLFRSLFFLRKPMRYMIIKDFKNFVRDPVQWSQLLIFLGLLAIYILNIRNLNYEIDVPFWKIIITYLNLVSVSLTLTTFTSRFIYPQISLEGRRFWILGILPLNRKDLLMAKFLFSFGGTLILSEIMIFLSCWMVEVPMDLALLNGVLMIFICLGLAGLSVGLGAIYPNFQEENPSKIVSGFGGTLNLVMSLFYVVLMVVLQVVPVYFYYVKEQITSSQSYYYILGGSLFASAVVTLITCTIPLYLGIRNFERTEL